MSAMPRRSFPCSGSGRRFGRSIPSSSAIIRGRAVPAADLLTPNQFELEQLTGRPCATAQAVREAVALLRRGMAPTGPRAVLVTSLRTDETPADALDMVAADDAGCSLLRLP